MSNLGWVGHLDKFLAALTALAAGGHLLHWFSQEWIVLLLAVLTAIATFIESRSNPTPPVTPDMNKRASQ